MNRITITGKDANYNFPYFKNCIKIKAILLKHIENTP